MRYRSLILGIAMFMGASPVWAGDPGLEAEIKDLKERLAQLESKVNSQSAKAAGASSGSSILSLPSGLSGVELSGFVDTAYSYNFNEPKDNSNDGRIFDTTANSFVVHNLQLAFEKPVDEYSPLGFKGVLMFGDDAEGTHSTGLFTGTDSIDIQQAYIEYLAPIGSGLDITFGKIPTLIGAEVIESIDNWNYSRSYLFGLAIPFTHTGVRFSYPLSETLSFTTGVNNGWDIADDTNIGKALEGQLAFEDGPFFISLNGMFSPEGNAAGTIANAERYIADVVASYQVSDDLALMMNYDFGYEEDSAADNKNASWQGFAAYAKYSLSDDWSLAGRYELLRDYDGYRTTIPTFSGGVGAGVGATDVTLQSYTLTSEYTLYDRLITRVEYRHDFANAALYGHDDTGLQNDQDTIALELIYPF